MITAIQLSDFAKDTLTGLTSPQKYLLPKYFYDERGSRIFSEIMQMPEYYLTRCEFDIFEKHSKSISRQIMEGMGSFDLIELGSGDGLKTKLLLRSLLQNKTNLRYIPVDISLHSLNGLMDSLMDEMPSLQVKQQYGDYFQVIKDMKDDSDRARVIMFLGSNIGNLLDEDLDEFLNELSELTSPGDKLLIGYDLKKSPSVIMDAYNDPHRLTRDFNFNHLYRINKELDADFDVDRFEFHVSYNPLNGKVQSYLVSKVQQSVYVGALERKINFKPWESIFMELSRKFDVENLNEQVKQFGFETEQTFYDTMNYFAVTLWIRS
jgi:L-histidine Nalpha-methyltransferase